MRLPKPNSEQAIKLLFDKHFHQLTLFAFGYVDDYSQAQEIVQDVFVFEEKQNDLPTLTTTFDNQSLETVLEELCTLLNTNHETRNDTIFFKPNN